MRTFARLILLCVSLVLTRAATHARPSQAEPGRDTRCPEAASKYVHPSPDKEHLTVEAEEAYEYRQEKMYLRVCGDSDDAFTRFVKESVESYEAARTLERLLPAVRKAGSPESKDPDAYAAIAAAYASHLVLLYRWRRTGADTGEGAVDFAKAIDRQNDLVIDAYARAVAACGTRADCEPRKNAWMQKLKGAYRLRHGSDAGLEELLRGALDRPMPNL
ncbi:MAG: hypothetical protein ACJ74Q_20525 [Pyrinomonadaceae bacterium]